MSHSSSGQESYQGFLDPLNVLHGCVHSSSLMFSIDRPNNVGTESDDYSSEIT